MDCIITFKILFKILGTLTLQAFLNEFKNRLTSALLQGGPFQNVQCLLAAHSTSHYPSSPVIRPGYRINFKILLLTFNALYGMAPSCLSSSDFDSSCLVFSSSLDFRYVLNIEKTSLTIGDSLQRPRSALVFLGHVSGSRHTRRDLKRPKQKTALKC